MILITGANGQTGRAIIRNLLFKGEEVRATGSCYRRHDGSRGNE